MNSVNMFAEFVDVDAALIDMPMSHHGIERPDRKNSLASLPALREHITAIPAIKAKNNTIINQSMGFKSITWSFHSNCTKKRSKAHDKNTMVFAWTFFVVCSETGFGKISGKGKKTTAT